MLYPSIPLPYTLPLSSSQTGLMSNKMPCVSFANVYIVCLGYYCKYTSNGLSASDWQWNVL